MPSKMILLYGVTMFASGCAILWIYWDRFKKPKKKIFISADCWLEVFVLLPRSQLGFGIAMISHRFDFYVDEHFKTRKWTLDNLEIGSKIGENGAKEMEIFNNNLESLPIPQISLPNKFIGFGLIWITYIDQNALTFLQRFQRFFTTSSTQLDIDNADVSVSEFVVLNIWPMFKETIHGTSFDPKAFRQMRQLAPSILCNCPCLKNLSFYFGILLEFPPDDSANASEGQAVAKWLFTPCHDNSLKVLSYLLKTSATEEQWSIIVEHIKAAFSAASSPVSFGIFFSFPPFSSFSVLLPFELTNEFTGEKLTLSQEDGNAFKLIRCPIVPKKRQQNIVNLDDRWNQINISIGGIDEGLLDDLLGPSGDY